MKSSTKPYKKLYRSCKNRMIAGVCSGLAHYFECDPTWVRLTFVLFLFLGGSAFLIYLVLWFLMPANPKI